jgi:hypothetical protein
MVVTSIKLSEIKELQDQGYKIVEGGDASKANSDYFVILERRHDDGTRTIRILCPTFLRGGIGFAKVSGGISY